MEGYNENVYKHFSDDLEKAKYLERWGRPGDYKYRYVPLKAERTSGNLFKWVSYNIHYFYL